jgi:hypothetical protein
MAFTLDTLASELGIDPATLAAKGDVVNKWNGYLSKADEQYRTASQEKKDALDTLEAAKREQAAIDEQIQKFGVTETSLAELRASNAALSAALEEVKKQGFNVNMPNLPSPKAPAVADPADQWKQGFRQMGAAMRVQAKYQKIHGKPYPDDPTTLVDEAIAHRMDVEAWGEQKYKFAEESERIQKETLAKQRAEWEAAAVNKYKENNPTRTPLDRPGIASRHPEIFKPRDSAGEKTFRNLPAKERIAQSVARSRAAIAASSDVV